MVLAESDTTEVLEGNHYFPPDAVRDEYLDVSPLHTRCPWKGKASYYNVSVGDDINPNAAWYYPKPWPLARKIKDHVAFWQGVVVEEVSDPAA